MRWIRLTLIALTTVALSAPLPSAAQSGAIQDTTQPVPKKKKGGLFGKVKGIANNKVVQQVAKTAACNMVPGGQLVVGAVDKKLNKKGAVSVAKDAAKDAAVSAAAAGLSGGENPCMPGLMGKVNPSALAGGVPAVPGVGVPGMPTLGMPSGAAMSAEQMKQLQEQYSKMGMSPVQMEAMQQQMRASPGAGLSADQLKQMEEQYRKMGMDPTQLQAMQQMMTNLPAGAAEAAVGVRAAETSAVAPALSREKGRLVLRGLPWTSDSEGIQTNTEEEFGKAIRNAAAEMIPTGKHYKVEVKVEDQGSKEQSQLLARNRAAVVVSFLIAEGLPEGRLTATDGGSDKDPRVVITATK